MAEKAKNYFEVLNNINVNDHTEPKGGLTYLSWAWAWAEFKKVYPLSYYTIYENEKGWNYFTDGKTCWVKTGVTVVLEDGKELEHIEYLPVMNYSNKSLPLDSVTSFDINKSIQRSLTKAVARHGLGLYIYAGEDLPEEEKDSQKHEKIKTSEVKSLTGLIARKGLSVDSILKNYKLDALEDMDAEMYVDCIAKLNKYADKKVEEK